MATHSIPTDNFDSRDIANGIPEQMAVLIASMVSGIPAEEISPETDDFGTMDDDYAMANKVAGFIYKNHPAFQSAYQSMPFSDGPIDKFN